MYIEICSSLLYLIAEIFTNGHDIMILDILSLGSIISGISVIICKNPILSILFLIGLFACVATYLIFIGFNFIGLSYLIVYIGAVSILFLFILMLINIRTSELQSNTSNSIPLTIFIGIIISYFLFKLLPYDISRSSNFEDANFNQDFYILDISTKENYLNNIHENVLFFITSIIWDGALAETNHITTIGNVMYTNYNIWLILASFILLLAMVGAIVITIKGPSSGSKKGGVYRSSGSSGINSKRYYSSLSKDPASDGETKLEFLEWFVGFTDGEGSFLFRPIGDKPHYIFEFRISLHVDDKDLLFYIKDNLELGSVVVKDSVCIYIVNKREEIKVLIEIFNKTPLNSTKYLNFICFKQAFELYINSVKKTEELGLKLEEIRNKMNSKRSEFNLPEEHTYRISPYWLLGFIEGEGSFYIISKDFQLVFDLSQTEKDFLLMQAIQDFLNKLTPSNLELPVFNGSVANSDISSLNKKNRIKAHHYDVYRLSVANTAYIRNIFIPFLNSLTWFSKKAKDFQDWKTILQLKDNGLHYTDEGVKLIQLINSQMNSRRLSTSGTVLTDRAAMYKDIERLLQEPSNFETREGRTWIISKNKWLISGVKQKIQLLDNQGNIINEFDSQTDCAKFLDTRQSTLSYRLKSNRSFLFGDKLCTLKVSRK